MDRALYWKYASYYIDKFKDYPNIKIDKKWPCENIMHIYIYRFATFWIFYGNISKYDNI